MHHNVTCLHLYTLLIHRCNLKYQAVELLLDHGADINLKDASGNAPIHLACRAGAAFEKDIFEKLLKRGADLSSRNKNGDTPIHLAVFHHNYRALLNMMSRQVNHGLPISILFVGFICSFLCLHYSRYTWILMYGISTVILLYW